MAPGLPRPLDHLQGRPVRVLAGLVLVGVLLLLADRAHHDTGWALFRGPVWDVERDRSAIELVGSAVLLATSVVLARLARRGAPVLLGWSVVLGVLAADDLLEGHERLAEQLAPVLSLPPLLGLRAVDLGEVLVFALYAGLAGIFLLLARRGGAAWGRAASRHLTVVLLASGVVVLGLDLLGVALSGRAPNQVVRGTALLEATLELVAVSALLAVALAVRPTAARSTSA